MAEKATIHATCIAVNSYGLLLRGKSGAGKSDLALRLIEAGGVLVADDQVCIIRQNNNLLASAPGKLQGLLEVRGVGICRYQFQASCKLQLVIDLDNNCSPERLPDLAAQQTNILEVYVPRFFLNPIEASALAKINAMLQLIDT